LPVLAELFELPLPVLLAVLLAVVLPVPVLLAVLLAPVLPEVFEPVLLAPNGISHLNC